MRRGHHPPYVDPLDPDTATDTAPHRQVRRRVGALALALTVLGGGATHAAVAHVTAVERAAAQQTAQAAAVRAERELQVRVADASSARLTQAALGYAAVRRTQALDVARAAVLSADAVVVDATVDLPAHHLTPLGQAATELAELIAAIPSVPAVTTPFHPQALLDPDASDAAPTDVRVAPRAHRHGDGRSAAPTAPPSAVTPRAVPAAASIAAEVVPAADPAAAPAAAPVPPAEPVAVALPAAAAATAGAAGEPAVAPVPVPVVPLAGSAARAAAVPTPATTADGEAQLAALDLDVSADVVAAAGRVVQLATQVQAAADAAAAEAAARAAAQEAAERAAREAADALARAVADADAAPNGQIPLELLCGVGFADDVLLRCDAAEALEELAAAYRLDHGRDLVVSSSYRSFDTQAALRAAKGGLAAPPGRSNHGRGLAVDLAGFGGLGQFDTPNYLWMKANAERFGWHHPAAMEPGGSGPPEPWHWEFGTEDL